MQQGQPEGGQWNFDKNNRKKWKGSPTIPVAYIPQTDKDHWNPRYRKLSLPF